MTKKSFCNNITSNIVTDSWCIYNFWNIFYEKSIEKTKNDQDLNKGKDLHCWASQRSTQLCFISLSLWGTTTQRFSIDTAPCRCSHGYIFPEVYCAVYLYKTYLKIDNVPEDGVKSCPGVCIRELLIQIPPEVAEVAALSYCRHIVYKCPEGSSDPCWTTVHIKGTFINRWLLSCLEFLCSTAEGHTCSCFLISQEKYVPHVSLTVFVEAFLRFLSVYSSFKWSYVVGVIGEGSKRDLDQIWILRKYEFI